MGRVGFDLDQDLNSFRHPKPTLQASENELKASLKSLKNRLDVARVLEIQERLLLTVLYGRRERAQYHEFDIPKRSGGTRRISAPPMNLRILQRKTHELIKIKYNPKQCVHGFVTDRSIATNAENHINKRFIFNADLEDYFPTIRIGRVIGVLKRSPFNFPEDVAVVFAQIACKDDGTLPQGSPLSPIISNIIAHTLDSALSRLAKERSMTYTRYADDITFSTNKPRFDSDICYFEKSWKPGELFRKIVTDSGFKINDKKVSLRQRFQHQEVTGVTVNEFKNVHRSHILQLQALVRNIEKFGYATAENFLRKNLARDVTASRYAQGKLGFIKMVRGEDDPIVRRLTKRLDRSLPGQFGPIKSLAITQPSPLRGLPRTWHGWSRIVARYSRSIFLVEVQVGPDLEIGTAFAIGKGLLATAGHNMCHGDMHVYDKDDIKVAVTKKDSINTPGSIDAGLLTCPSRLTECPLMESQCRIPEVGEELLAIGFPTVPLRQPTLRARSGLVESISHSLDSKTVYIQMSFQSPGGLSGGPLVDKRGFVVGIMVENTFEKYDNSGQVPPAFGQATPFEYLEDLRYQSRMTNSE